MGVLRSWMKWHTVCLFVFVFDEKRFSFFFLKNLIIYTMTMNLCLLIFLLFWKEGNIVEQFFDINY